VQWQTNVKCVNNGKNITAIHDNQNKAIMNARWWRDGLRATGLQWLQDTSYNHIDHGLCSAFVYRWHEDTSSFHLPFGEMTVTLDDVSCLLHLHFDVSCLLHLHFDVCFCTTRV